MTTRSVLKKPSLLPLLGVVSFAVVGSIALASTRLQNDVQPKTAFKSAGARADEKTLAKARAIKRRMEAKKIEEASLSQNSLHLSSVAPSLEGSEVSFSPPNSINSPVFSTPSSPPRSNLYSRLSNGLDSSSYDAIVVFRLSLQSGWEDLAEKALQKLCQDLQKLRKEAGFIPKTRNTAPKVPLPPIPSSTTYFPTPEPFTSIAPSRPSSISSIYSTDSISSTNSLTPSLEFPLPPHSFSANRSILPSIISEESWLEDSSSSDVENSSIHSKQVDSEVKQGQEDSSELDSTEEESALILLEIIKHHSPPHSPPKNLNFLRNGQPGIRRKSVSPPLSTGSNTPPRNIRKTSIPLPLPLSHPLSSNHTSAPTKFSFPSPPRSPRTQKRQSMVSFSPIHLSSSPIDQFSNPIPPQPTRRPSLPLSTVLERPKRQIQGLVGIMKGMGSKKLRDRDSTTSGFY